MACPYCGSGDWGYEMDGDGSPELVVAHPRWVMISRRCECRDCGKLFLVKELYANDNLCTFEKIKEDE